jgi:hypothetical protein
VTAGIVRRNHGSNHSYYVDGEKFAGVTTLLGAGLPKPALMNWAGNVTAEYAVDHWAELGDLKPSARLASLKRARFDDRDAAARRGTEVHRLAERLVAGEEVDVPDELAGHVDSYVKFLNEWEPDPTVVEGVVAHRKWKYCGTFDLVATMRGQVWLLDLKTSRSGIYPETALQLAAYQHAETYLGPDGEEHPMAGLGIERAAAIHVRSDGYDLIPLETGQDVFSAATRVMWLARMVEGMDEWRGEALTPPRPPAVPA